jgi:hypothetical protein
VKLISVLFVSGVIDSANDSVVTAELATSPNCDTVVVEMNRDSFPCEVKEGDSFHLIKLDSESKEFFVVCGDFRTQ